MDEHQMSALMLRMDAVASEADQMARWLDTMEGMQKWVHRDLRAIRSCADRIAAHLRQELAEAEAFAAKLREEVEDAQRGREAIARIAAQDAANVGRWQFPTPQSTGVLVKHDDETGS